MTKTITQLIKAIKRDLSNWAAETKPWFRGESDNMKDPVPPLYPKIFKFEHNVENYLLQSFRRQAGGLALANVPHREDKDLWLFLAQHYGLPTRLLDWTEGALNAFYFAINQDNPNPRVYMLNPRKLNKLAETKTYDINYPLSWGIRFSALYVNLAWKNRKVNEIKRDMEEKIKQKWQHIDDDKMNEKLEQIRKSLLKIPIAFPATYQDHRMIAQRSCFTIHGTEEKSIQDILKDNKIEVTECLFEYKIDSKSRSPLLKDLSMLGISAASIFPDLDRLAIDLKSDVEGF